MTVFLPLEASSPLPHTPSFLVPTPEPAAHLRKVIKTIMKARRIAVVCGAGISVQAGIPDFRSSDGLFQALKKDNPTLSSGRDLFDASVFNSEGTTFMFCQMIAQLAELSEVASPTAFHHLLRSLDDRRRLLRVYTQNIDALERKCGLTFGVPESEAKRNKPRICKPRPDVPNEAGPSSIINPPQNRLPTPPIETPRCIPLHGTLQYMHCQVCTLSFPLRDHLPVLAVGKPPYCPECAALEETRQLVGKRSRGVGKLRPSVVLYNEEHKDGEEVGDVVRKDLTGNSKGKGRAGADLLLVVGTSLRVPGTKRIAREFSKAVHSRDYASSAPHPEGLTSAMGLATPTPSPRRSPADDEEPPIRAVYLNLDFPVPTREWEGVFDVWIRGDAQVFARMVQEEMEKEKRAKEEAAQRKRKREEAALAADLETHMSIGSENSGASGKKRKSVTGPEGSTKRQKTTPPTPVSMKMPPKAKRLKRSGEDVPLEPAKRRKKSGLTIRIPPRPIVLITTPVPKFRSRVLATPTPSPPSSPLSPAPSSLPRPRGRSTLSPLTPLSPPSKARNYDFGWEGRGTLTELSDEDSSDECSDSYLPTLHHGPRGPDG